ncbi:MAG: dihydroxyacetone kinase subunit DhaK [Kiritimatiellae bacterium]|nr:dihydroxyacetone kinase subunit DhaK [Kiritimatiellia bacterium]
MKKFINDPANLTAELLDGLVKCYPDKLALKNDKIVVRANPKPADKVALVTLGGTGHEPAMEGFVGEGMLDASVAGDIFAAPGGEKVFEALELMNRPAGVLLITLNHNGDRMSANKALRKAAKAGLNVKEIVVHDDIAQGPHTPIEDKRGLGGCIPLIKVLGAAAEEGKSLDELVALGEKFNEGIATLSVALKVATHPQNGGEIGAIDEDKMEVGMGQHGEGGGGIMPVKSADETAELMVKSLIEATGVKSGDKAFLIVNGSGATTLMEMLIVFRKAKAVLEAQGVSVLPGRCTELLTVQEMAGFQMILCKCCDTCARYLAAKSDSPYWTCLG